MGLVDYFQSRALASATVQTGVGLGIGRSINDHDDHYNHISVLSPNQLRGCFNIESHHKTVVWSFVWKEHKSHKASLFR